MSRPTESSRRSSFAEELNGVGCLKRNGNVSKKHFASQSTDQGLMDSQDCSRSLPFGGRCRHNEPVRSIKNLRLKSCKPKEPADLTTNCSACSLVSLMPFSVLGMHKSNRAFLNSDHLCAALGGAAATTVTDSIRTNCINSLNFVYMPPWFLKAVPVAINPEIRPSRTSYA
jgi:hypothetical protein